MVMALLKRSTRPLPLKSMHLLPAIKGPTAVDGTELRFGQWRASPLPSELGLGQPDLLDLDPYSLPAAPDLDPYGLPARRPGPSAPS